MLARVCVFVRECQVDSKQLSHAVVTLPKRRSKIGRVIATVRLDARPRVRLFKADIRLVEACLLGEKRVRMCHALLEVVKRTERQADRGARCGKSTVGCCLRIVPAPCQGGTGLTQTSADMHPTLRDFNSRLELIISPACRITGGLSVCLDAFCPSLFQHCFPLCLFLSPFCF